MIFSRLLKRKWQSKDENVRIQSINELDGEADKEILLSLLKNDDSAKVKLSILEKFDDISLWLDALKDKNNKQIKKKAQSIIESHLLCESHNQEISTEVKFQIVDDISNTKLFEKWLSVEPKTNVIITLLEKINKSSVLNRYFSRTQDVDVLSYIVDREDKESELNRLKKHCSNQDVLALIDRKLSNLNVVKITKDELNKRIQLVLAKLLKINDCEDFDVFLSELEALKQEWALLNNSFDLLAIRERDKFLNKYQELMLKVDETRTQLKERSIQIEIAQKAKRELENASKEIQLALAQMQEGVRKAIHESFIIDSDVFNSEVESLKQKIEASQLGIEEQKALLKQLLEINKEANLVDKITNALEVATQALAKISQVAVPSDLAGFEDKYQLLKELEETWERAVVPFTKYVPRPLIDAKLDISKRWKIACAPLLKEQKLKLNKAKSKLKNVNQLIDSGKFNPAFGVFKSALRLINDLSDKQKQFLERELCATQARLDEISDWEHYVSTPKKIELLERVSQLVERPNQDLKVQADLVKSYRQQWNNLGHADSDKEKELNEAFNLACEDAFSPCREFFASQELIREENLKSRQLLLTQIRTFIVESLTEANEKELSNKIKLFNQQWKDSGEVDRKAFNTVNSEYREMLSELRKKQHSLHSSNENRKKVLIEQAKGLLSLDNHEAVQKAKQLQIEWKQIGFAGKTSEKTLWSAFRQVNDEIFELRSLAIDNKKQETSIINDKYTKLISEFREILKNSDDKQSLSSLSERLRVTIKGFYLESQQPKSLLKALEQLRVDVSEKLKNEDKISQQTELKLLFDVLERSLQKKTAVSKVSEFNQLSNTWKKRLIGTSFEQDTISCREKETVVLEVIFNAQSPTQASDVRRQVQVELMQEQMSTGSKPSREIALIEWLEKGPFSQNDSQYLARVKQLFS